MSTGSSTPAVLVGVLYNLIGLYEGEDEFLWLPCWVILLG